MLSLDIVSLDIVSFFIESLAMLSLDIVSFFISSANAGVPASASDITAVDKAIAIRERVITDPPEDVDDGLCGSVGFSSSDPLCRLRRHAKILGLDAGC